MTTNYKETIYGPEMLPNIMERDYGRGIVLSQCDDEGGDCIPFQVFNFKKEDWDFAGDYYQTDMVFNTLEEAEAQVASLLGQ